MDELLRKVGLYEVRDRWANRLSGGMKRRLGIAQAIVGNPKIIVVMNRQRDWKTGLLIVMIVALSAWSWGIACGQENGEEIPLKYGATR